MLNITKLLKGAAASAAHMTGSEEAAKQTEPLPQPCCAAQSGCQNVHLWALVFGGWKSPQAKSHICYDFMQD